MRQQRREPFRRHSGEIAHSLGEALAPLFSDRCVTHADFLRLNSAILF